MERRKEGSVENIEDHAEVIREGSISSRIKEYIIGVFPFGTLMLFIILAFYNSTMPIVYLAIGVMAGICISEGSLKKYQDRKTALFKARVWLDRARKDTDTLSWRKFVEEDVEKMNRYLRKSHFDLSHLGVKQEEIDQLIEKSRLP